MSVASGQVCGVVYGSVVWEVGVVDLGPWSQAGLVKAQPPAQPSACIHWDWETGVKKRQYIQYRPVANVLHMNELCGGVSRIYISLYSVL